MSVGMTTSTGSASDLERAIKDADNNSLIIRLHFTVNHLSRWLTPIHDPTMLTRTVRRGEPSVKDLLLRMRNEEQRIFPKMHVISVRIQPDLDKLSEPVQTDAEIMQDQRATPLEVMAEFRRLRQSTCSLLRSLPDTAWRREGVSRREHDWTIRALAEHLATHDLHQLREMDRALDRVGAREGITTASRVNLDELLKLAPTSMPRS